MQGGETPTVLESFRVDYVAHATPGGASLSVITNDNDTLNVEATTWSPTGSSGWGDLVVNFDLDPPGSPSDSAVLEIENAHSNPYKTSFAHSSNPSGSSTDWFRFRTDKTTSTWNESSRGEVLVRLYWHTSDADARSGFFDPEFGQRSALRVFRYVDLVTTTPDTFEVGLEAKRPDESATSASAIDTIIITSTPDPKPVACFTPEPGGDNTWEFTDQFLDASCSTGDELEFSWDTGSGFSSFSSDTVIEFFGHSTQGSKTMKVRVRDVAYSPATQDTFPMTINVDNDYVTMSGPTYVTNKLLKTYTASDTSNWYERYDPETLTQWYFNLDTATVYNRIWPAGDYTRRLRAEHIHAPLARRFLDVEVCSVPGCSPPEFVAGPDLSRASAAPAEAEWPLFGGGPWVATEDGVVRFYDLTGLHEPGSPFASVGWFGAEASGVAYGRDGAMAVAWYVLPAKDPQVREVRFDVGGSGRETFRFGLALDPDLGRSAGDDRVRLESDGLVVIFDQEEAIGFLLQSAGADAVTGVQQYGVERAAPRSSRAMNDAVTRAGVELLDDGGDDVQLLIRAGVASGTASWRLIALRGDTPAEVREKARSFSD